MVTMMARPLRVVSSDGEEPEPQHERDTSNPDSMPPLPQRKFTDGPALDRKLVHVRRLDLTPLMGNCGTCGESNEDGCACKRCGV
ncbi:hypothetical protein GCM10012287_46650 [Streptomyces daqingensis]|uniref:Uncharacterized protein n=1 Tax=Streptomyces daqingensis TaxID=1472640 RepID=A0ABQ2MP87_9ACTN|nr:hypothetical protein [Streptomyces daqingensis]GGO55420.1 hypothetical protein GCM10012287_46650 [Streptomyces daqingensis]